MAVSLWIDYLRDMFTDPSKLYGIVDSGIFLGPEDLFKIGATSYGVFPLFAPDALLNDA